MILKVGIWGGNSCGEARLDYETAGNNSEYRARGQERMQVCSVERGPSHFLGYSGVEHTGGPQSPTLLPTFLNLIYCNFTFSQSSCCFPNQNKLWDIVWTGELGFPGGSDGKEPACNVGDPGSIWVGKISWRREWLPTPVFLPGESCEQRSLTGYSPWGHKQSDTTEQLSTHKNADGYEWRTEHLAEGILTWRLVQHCGPGSQPFSIDLRLFQYPYAQRQSTENTHLLGSASKLLGSWQWWDPLVSAFFFFFQSVLLISILGIIFPKLRIQD